MSEPCISKIAHNYNCFYMMQKNYCRLRKEYLSLYESKTIKHQLYGTATSHSKQDLRN